MNSGRDEMPKIGDMVVHIDETHKNRVGEVVAHCPGHEWLRVKTFDGKTRIWAVANMAVLDPDTIAFINEMRGVTPPPIDSPEATK